MIKLIKIHIKSQDNFYIFEPHQKVGIVNSLIKEHI